MNFIKKIIKLVIIIVTIISAFTAFIASTVFTNIPTTSVAKSKLPEYKYIMYDWVDQDSNRDFSVCEPFATPTYKPIEKEIISAKQLTILTRQEKNILKEKIKEQRLKDKYHITHIEDTIIYDSSNEDYYYLLCVIVGEAQWCSWEEQIYVGSVVLNRVASKWYSENTIKEVCLAKNQYACFWGENPLAYREPTETNKKAAQFLMENGSQLPGNVIFQALFEQGDGIYMKMPDTGTYFCYKND